MAPQTLRVHLAFAWITWFSISGLMISGCASWDVPEKSVSLPVPRMSRDSVLIEIEFVRVGANQEAALADIWRALDEQQLPPELRRHLGENGIRCGLLGTQLPDALRQFLVEDKPSLQQLEEGHALDEGDGFDRYRQLPCRAGRRYKIAAASKVRDEQVVLINEDGRLSAHVFREARGLFSLVSSPLGDGRVKVHLTPLVEHGAFRQRIIPGEAHFLINAGREERELHMLTLETVLTPGTTLLMSCTAEPKGLGGWYFSDAVQGGYRSVMLVRLVQTQLDDLFSDEPAGQSLTTPLD